MATAYFIGGPSRTGKTTVIQKLITKRPMLATSTDAIEDVLKGTTSKEANPRLFKVERGPTNSRQNIDAMLYHPETVIPHYIGEYEETWKGVIDFARTNLTDSKDIALEGVAVLPHNLSKLTYEFKAVFIVNLEDRTESILQHAHENTHDWLHKYNDETILAFCNLSKYFNQYYYDEARKHGYPIVVIDNNNFDASIDEAVQVLLN